MKTVNVVAAVIVHDGKVYATERGYGEFKGDWEFLVSTEYKVFSNNNNYVS